MSRRKVTCPNSGTLEEIEYFEKPSDGSILGVVSCTAFRPATAVACDLLCADRLNRGLGGGGSASGGGGPASGDGGGDGPGDKDGRPPWSPAHHTREVSGTAAVTVLPRVSDLMTTEVVAVGPDTGLETAARLMVARRLSGLPVVKGSTPIGVVTLADLVDPDAPRSDAQGFPIFYRFVGGGPIPDGDVDSVGTGCVADVMSPFVLSIEASATITEAASRMLAESVHRLLVREGTELVGIVTMTDLLRGFATLFGH
jgi:CBS domain-containing protein